MKEAIAALVAIVCLPLVFPLVLMAQIPGLKKLPKWIWNTFFVENELDEKLLIGLFLLFTFLISAFFFNKPVPEGYDPYSGQEVVYCADSKRC